jgi:hypothetical protein
VRLVLVLAQAARLVLVLVLTQAARLVRAWRPPLPQGLQPLPRT